MKKHSVKICLLLSLVIASLFWFFGSRPASAETDLTCSLGSEVPVSQVTDQLISNDQSTAVKIMRALDELNSFSNQAISGARNVLALEESCSPPRCHSQCRETFVRKSGFPNLSDTSFCKEGYACNHYSPKVFLQAGTDNDPAITSLGCETLPDGQVGTIKDHWYEIVGWTEQVSGNTCDAPPDCGAYNCVELAGNPVSGKTGNWMMCGNPMTWRNADPNAPYNHYDVYQASTRIASCLVACVDYTGDSGECNIEWSEPACLPDPCAGQACDFAALDQKANSVYSASTGAKAAYQKIDDVLRKGIYSLPFLGNFCDIPVLGGFCLPGCWVAGLFGGNAAICPTELSVTLKLHEKSLTNIRNCQTNPQNFFEDQSGKILLRCEEVMPDILKKCYPGNFYCCQ